MLSPTQYVAANARLDELIRESAGDQTKIQALLRARMRLRDAYYGESPLA